MRLLRLFFLLILLAIPLWIWVTNPLFMTSPDSDSKFELRETGLFTSPQALEETVRKLVSTTVPRNRAHSVVLNEVGDQIFETFKRFGLKPNRQEFVVDGRPYFNVSVLLGPATTSRLVIGAHYDVADLGPGADDNASGVACLLALASQLKASEPLLMTQVELVAYTLEEPPSFGTDVMGSAFHARSLKESNVQVSAMLSLEMMGYYQDQTGTQDYPIPILKALYPTKANFLAMVGRSHEWSLLRKMKELFVRNSRLPLYTMNSPFIIPGIDLSDHASYWQAGYPALLITDTSFFRNPHYHKLTDTPETLDYQRMAEAVEGVAGIVLGWKP